MEISSEPYFRDPGHRSLLHGGRASNSWLPVLDNFSGHGGQAFAFSTVDVRPSDVRGASGFGLRAAAGAAARRRWGFGVGSMGLFGGFEWWVSLYTPRLGAERKIFPLSSDDRRPTISISYIMFSFFLYINRTWNSLLSASWCFDYMRYALAAVATTRRA